MTMTAVEIIAPARCGDGIVWAGSGCDDGNDVNEDDCEQLSIPRLRRWLRRRKNNVTMAMKIHVILAETTVARHQRLASAALI